MTAAAGTVMVEEEATTAGGARQPRRRKPGRRSGAAVSPVGLLPDRVRTLFALARAGEGGVTVLRRRRTNAKGDLTRWGRHQEAGTLARGHRLWVAEPYLDFDGDIWFAADGLLGPAVLYRPAYSLPVERSRLTLTLDRDSWVEPLAAVDDAQALAEGVVAFAHTGFPDGVGYAMPEWPAVYADERPWIPRCRMAATPARAYALYWDHMHGCGAWEMDRHGEVVVLTATVSARHVLTGAASLRWPGPLDPGVFGGVPVLPLPAPVRTPGAQGATQGPAQGPGGAQ